MRDLPGLIKYSINKNDWHNKSRTTSKTNTVQNMQVVTIQHVTRQVWH